MVSEVLHSLETFHLCKRLFSRQLFCNVCYERLFQPVEFTVDYYSGIITPEDIER
jgi:hypothetical protein